MFGIGKKNIPPRVGAREKIRLAQQIQGGGGAAVLSKREGKETSAAVSVITIYVAALAVSWMASEKYISAGGLNLRLGWDALDNLLFKTQNINVTGAQEIDYALLIAIRALALLLAAGVVPFVALVVQKSLDAAHMNPFRTVWGTPVGILLVVIGFKEYLGPMLAEVLNIISG
ncbi:MAG TPA: hypothetical protein VEF76_07285 [Patescibacteria group bacterium]|nr:hypothetical protein [Patescibacteria group bacterium]